MEKTSKIKSIGKEIRERTPSSGGKTVFYHSLMMENGDTISLGKQKKGAFTVGQEIAYYQDGEDKMGNPKRKEKGKHERYLVSKTKGCMETGVHCG